MRICIDMDTLTLVAWHDEPDIRDGLAQLQGTRSHHLYFDDSAAKTFLSPLTTLELRKLLAGWLGDFDTSALDDDDMREVAAAYCDALTPPKVARHELEAQLEVMEDFLEDDPDTSPEFRYVYGAAVPQIVDELLTQN